MAVDRLETDYHLTQRGWVIGDVRSMFTADNKTVPVPPDRLLTLTHKIYQASGHSPEERTVRVTWRGYATDEQIADLRAKFAPPFDLTDE
jgi:hypothetical protein